MPDGAAEDLPLVTIAIPTHNRVALVLRAVQSALAQDYPQVEVVVSDNASTDETEPVLAQYCERAPGLRYVRRAHNEGATANFVHALDSATGEYFMWLADDDWLDPSFVSTCMEVLRADPRAVLAAGDAVYYHDGTESWREQAREIRDRSAGRRVLRYYGGVRMNGEFYGITTTALRRSVPLADELGADWVHMAAVAAAGSIRRAPCRIHRDAGGASDAMRPGLRSFAVPIARRAVRDLATVPALRSAPRHERLVAAIGTGVVLVWRYGIRTPLQPYFIGQRLKAVLPERRYVQLRRMYRLLVRDRAA